MKLYKEYLLVKIFKCIESFFDIYCQSKDMADFDVLQGKLEPPDLNKRFSMKQPDLYYFEAIKMTSQA